MTTQSAAHDIDTYYWDRISEEYGTLFKFQKKEIGFVDFHNCLYTIVLELPQFLCYDDLKQDTLVQRLLELQQVSSQPDKTALKVCIPGHS